MSHYIPEYKKFDFTGRKFGALEVLGIDGEFRGMKTRWLVRCDLCGETSSKTTANLLENPNLSCGCLREEKLQEGRKALRDLDMDGTNIAHLSENRKLNKNSSTGIRGVSRGARSHGKFRATIVFRGKQYDLGIFDKIEDAAAARKEAEEQIYGPFIEWYERHKK